MLLIVGIGAVVWFIVAGFFVFRVYRELRPTLAAARHAAKTMERTLEGTQEIADHVKSISENLERGSIEAQITMALARDSIDRVKQTAAIVLPIKYTIQGVKELYKRNGATRAR